ncbi:MAG: hypothetical protein CGW95_16545, partial [Phenylobacterium zucineum]
MLARPASREGNFKLFCGLGSWSRAGIYALGSKWGGMARSLKNLSADLLSNDQQIQRCFLAAANRFGMIITGYSGRDANVMTMIRAALDQTNPFPAGLIFPRKVDGVR